tara:strand:+ start:232 stop:402 length:171 start_codon:yes stop_codon:yes gene_type:complete
VAILHELTTELLRDVIDRYGLAKKQGSDEESLCALALVVEIVIDFEHWHVRITPQL